MHRDWLGWAPPLHFRLQCCPPVRRVLDQALVESPFHCSRCALWAVGGPVRVVWSCAYWLSGTGRVPMQGKRRKEIVPCQPTQYYTWMNVNCIVSLSHYLSLTLSLYIWYTLYKLCLFPYFLWLCKDNNHVGSATLWQKTFCAIKPFPFLPYRRVLPSCVTENGVNTDLHSSQGWEPVYLLIPSARESIYFVKSAVIFGCKKNLHTRGSLWHISKENWHQASQQWSFLIWPGGT